MPCFVIWAGIVWGPTDPARIGPRPDRIRLACSAGSSSRRPLHGPCQRVRAGGGVPAHVDDSALTVVFTPVPEALLAAPPGRRAPLRPVATDGWHAVVFPGAQVGPGLPGVVPTAHAAAPVAARRLSVTVFAYVDHATLRGSTCPGERPARTVAAWIRQQFLDGARVVVDAISSPAVAAAWTPRRCSPSRPSAGSPVTWPVAPSGSSATTSTSQNQDNRDSSTRPRTTSPRSRPAADGGR